ncbi:acyl-CoA dehydrogenase [Oceanisphaera pacifica]|uniref:Acyl-coenzyme A dehydrogenase n=1 Tax=Oceanisphaera pacifica TaxID=2818389 RepID=A0ABS3NI12_9GAMM|nr:acyl-CoA dehydrogenase [Oceanisphaera pacifica]MBO1520224.1 acyl-CoA dehydrogenase [Oceanisphaera pacifica]
MSLRKNWISKPAFATFKKILPPLSVTEREAMEAGSVWWDGELFSGKPDWSKLLSYGPSRLSEEEQHFLDNQVETLLGMLDDHQIVNDDRELPEAVWDYIKQQGFFSLIIPKEYGGRDFSAYANSTIVARIASRSVSAAVTVMVPNSLGPGELLMHYGTQAQKDRWLPGLAKGDEVPCFALTGPEAGSDAGAIPDSGVVCQGEYEGEQVLGIRLNWDKRYITLAPRATVLGLAFKLFDPDALLGDNPSLGITCALIPTSHTGVKVGDRHFPMGLAFLNGTTCGKDVFIPLSWIIGGPEYAGRGWRMLVECLSAGRGISLPALGTASGHLSVRSTSAYAYVRKQFGLSIGKFEGVQEALARIGGLTYQLEATRRLTAKALDLKESPAIITAISKYHMTEMARTALDDAMDVHAGKAIQMGPKNYLAHNYMGIPVAITVEGANILTRNLMIFGQGATRCHPYVLKELESAANPDEAAGLQEFDRLLFKHIGFATGNVFGALWQGLTGARFNASPVSGETAVYYRQLARMSKALALCADVSMLILGGDLKRKEMISARLGDVLSHLYLGSATLKFFEDNGRPSDELPFVHYALTRNLHLIGEALDGFFANFPNRGAALTLKALIFPLGNRYKKPLDKHGQAISKQLMTPGSAIRERLTQLCYVPEADKPGLGEVEAAFLAMAAVQDSEKKLHQAQKDGTIDRKLAFSELLAQGKAQHIINDDEARQLAHADTLRRQAIAVDSFKPGVL